MKSEKEVKMLRCGRGYFTKQSIVDALKAEGIEMTKATYTEREKGRIPWKTNEIKALAKILRRLKNNASALC